jgi:PhnB protein
MKLQPQLSLVFNGQCEAAFRLYERSLGGTIAFMMLWGQSPQAGEAPPGWESKVYHATLKIGDTAILGSDYPAAQHEPPRGFSIILQMDDPDRAERIFRELSENGKVGMPLQETFWAARFATWVDQFGIPWSVNCERPVEIVEPA